MGNGKSQKISTASDQYFLSYVKKTTEGGQIGERIKCLIFDSEMCTLQKVGGKDSKGRRVL